MSRDPRKDPRPGDALIYGPQWQSERIDVFAFDGKMVHFRRLNGAEGYFNMASWRELMTNAEVVHVAAD